MGAVAEPAPVGDLGLMLEVERLAGQGAKVAIHRAACGWVATAFRDHPDLVSVLYVSADGDTRLEAAQRLHQRTLGAQ